VVQRLIKYWWAWLASKSSATSCLTETRLAKKRPPLRGLLGRPCACRHRVLRLVVRWPPSSQTLKHARESRPCFQVFHLAPVNGWQSLDVAGMRTVELRTLRRAGAVRQRTLRRGSLLLGRVASMPRPRLPGSPRRRSVGSSAILTWPKPASAAFASRDLISAAKSALMGDAVAADTSDMLGKYAGLTVAAAGFAAAFAAVFGRRPALLRRAR
jgi:hypothetical protein